MIVSADKKAVRALLPGRRRIMIPFNTGGAVRIFPPASSRPPFPRRPHPDRLDLGQHAPGAPARVWFYPVTWHSPENYGYTLPDNLTEPETKMTKLTLQEQMLKAGLVTHKKMAKVQRTAKKSRVQAREAREAVEEKSRHSLSGISS